VAKAKAAAIAARARKDSKAAARSKLPSHHNAHTRFGSRS
jgi:hypothetical protein